jgi:hypothetical protein
MSYLFAASEWKTAGMAQYRRHWEKLQAKKKSALSEMSCTRAYVFFYFIFFFFLEKLKKVRQVCRLS